MTEQTITQTKEVRFAVVMYGGVSLAIYINGIAQELYHLVRSTATRANGDSANRYLFKEEELGGAGKIYRQLGEMLGSRFVVDILSGTSAGGINAVFLAKALANGQSFEQLRDLWIQEGDIGVLINDRQSGLDQEGLKFKGQPASLLNSQRMYYKLLYALDTMNPDLPAGGPPQGKQSPYVEELDLFVTATDIHGLVQKTRLAGGSTEEYRYKNVFRFRYATAEAAGGVDINDFKRENNPFLAFAARCTSAFPFAFEPMRLDDVKEVVAAPAFRKQYGYDPEGWSGFYKDYLQEDGSSAGFETRSFGDGGYLDNKPFSYVTETLLRRRADLPVDRKLIYIEPAPEHPAERDIDVRPDALQNVTAALLTLPRYETIREDLGLIMERNQMIRRVGAILKQIRYASRSSLTKNVRAWQMGGSDWAKKYLDEEVLGWYGPGYAAYHQLRVASVLDDLGSALVRAMGLEEHSEEAQKFREDTLESWRQAYYRIDPHDSDTRKSENDLLFRLDVSWRIRRLRFMQNLIDELFDGLAELTPGIDEAVLEEARRRAREIVTDSGGKEGDWPFTGEDEKDRDARAAYRQALLWLKARYNEAYKDLRASGRLLRSRSILTAIERRDPKIAGDENLLAFGEHLRALKEALENKADEEIVHERMEMLSQAMASGEGHPKVKGVIRNMLSTNARQCKQILGYGSETAEQLPPTGLESSYPDALKKAQACLEYFYDRFEYYDMLVFPLFFGTEVGESDVVEIIRISPEDAPSLRPGSQKLAGTRLGNFGAFFVREWRENDILWGRLDGAECLINALLPGDEHAAQRADLIREAHQAILEETFLGEDQKQLFEALKSGAPAREEDVDQVKQKLARALGGASGLLERFRRDHRVDSAFPPETTLTVSSRASRVAGKILAAISEKNPAALTNPVGMIARLGGLFNGLVQLAMPHSLPNLLFNNLVWLFYLLALLLIFGGSLARLPDMMVLGAIALGVIVAAHLIVFYLQSVLKRNLPALRTIHGLVKVLALLAVAGLVFLMYMGLVFLGVLQLPPGALGDWLRNISVR